MEILRYNDLDDSGLEVPFDRTVLMLQAGDFRAADVKRLRGTPSPSTSSPNAAGQFPLPLSLPTETDPRSSEAPTV